MVLIVVVAVLGGWLLAGLLLALVLGRAIRLGDRAHERSVARGTRPERRLVLVRG